MPAGELHAVTGVAGYTGKYIARLLLENGQRVLSLSGHPQRPHEFGEQVKVAPFNFDRPDALAASLKGVVTLYNTYWVRFSYRNISFGKAVENTITLVRAAEAAGVQRIVHVSITNPSPDSMLPYFRGKSLLEQVVRQSRLSYAILRPTVIFGLEDILINNMAYLLRKFPVFAIPGDGGYSLQPIYVGDMAQLAVQAGQEKGSVIMDAVGPEIYTFEGLARLLAGVVKSRAILLHLPPALALTLARGLGMVFQDVMLTRDEIDGLMAGLLVSSQPPTGKTLLSTWLEQNADRVGKRYASEVKRHFQER